jgi:hypothetical protein
MARRPEFSAKVMTRDELNRLKHSLSLLSPSSVQDSYQQSLERCRLKNGTPPAPRFVQELVTAWRVLWRWRE